MAGSQELIMIESNSNIYLLRVHLQECHHIRCYLSSRLNVCSCQDRTLAVCLTQITKLKSCSDQLIEESVTFRELFPALHFKTLSLYQFIHGFALFGTKTALDV